MDPHRRSVLRTVVSPLGLLATSALALGLAGAGCGVFDWADDCGHNLGRPGCSGALATGTGATGSGGTGGVTTSTGGDVTGCTDPKSCPAPPPGPCASLGMATCTDHVCGLAYTEGDAPSQVYGNCKKNHCDASGVMTAVADDTNLFESGNPCEPYVCSAGMSQLQPAATGASCALTGTVAGFCEPSADPAYFGILVCAACGPGNTGACTGGWICSQGRCVPPACANGILDPGETDQDCGGSLCLPCDVGMKCNNAKDCFSHVCNVTCQAPSCSDNVQNGQETDVDCGGPMCKKCSDTSGCALPKDCQSGVCKPSAPGSPNTCQAPSCIDGVKNGDETGVDCGSPADGGMGCPACGT